MPFLIQKNADGATIQAWQLRDGTVTVGRGDECNAKVDDERLSRQHFTITENNGKFILKDLGSKHGTRVNGLPVTEQELNRGDEIRAGATDFEIKESQVTVMMKSLYDKPW